MKKYLSLALSIITLITNLSLTTSAIEDMKNEIFLKIGVSYGYSLGNQVPIDLLRSTVVPFEENEIAYIPIDFVAQCFEIKTVKNQTDKSLTLNKITIKNQSSIIEIRKEENTKVNNFPATVFKTEKINCSAPAKLIDNVLYAPLDMIEKVFSKNVYYNNNLIIISKVIIDTSSPIITKMNADFLAGNKLTMDEIIGTSFVNDNWYDRTMDGNLTYGTKTLGTSQINGVSKTAITFNTNSKPVANYYFSQKISLTQDIFEKDLCLVSFYAKSTNGITPKINVILEQGDAITHYKSLAQEVRITDQWKRYDFPFVAKMTHPTATTTFYLAFGYDPQTVEVADLKAINCKKNHSINELPSADILYDGEQENTLWRENVLNNIETNRKHSTNIKVIDEIGNPINGAIVTLETIGQEFNFGTSVGQHYIVGTAQGADATANGLTAEENISIFKQTAKQYFNTAIPENALKWPLWVDRVENSRECMRILKEMGLRTRGHALYWDSWDYIPKDIREQYGSGITGDTWKVNDYQGLDNAVKSHITSMAGEFKDSVIDWDVLNEPTKSRSSFLKNSVFGQETYIKDWFDTARIADNDANLYVNEMEIIGDDNSQYTNFKAIVNGMIQNNVDFVGIGLQAHFGSNPVNPSKFLDQINYFTNLDKKVQITEYDMLSANENLQANYLKDLLLATFSNPNVEGFNMWGHWDNDHWRRNSPMFRGDWSLKPAGQIWYRMKEHILTTNVEGYTDIRGIFSPNLINGDYKITISLNGIEQEFNANFKNGNSKIFIYRQEKQLAFIYDNETRKEGQIFCADVFGEDNYKVAQWGGYTTANGENVIIKNTDGIHGKVANMTGKYALTMQHNISATKEKLSYSFAFNPKILGRSRIFKIVDLDTDGIGTVDIGQVSELVKVASDSKGNWGFYYFGTYQNDTTPQWHWFNGIKENDWYYLNFLIDPLNKSFSVYLNADTTWVNKFIDCGKLNSNFKDGMRMFEFYTPEDITYEENIYYDDISLSFYTDSVKPILSTIDKNGNVPTGTKDIWFKYGSTFKTGKIPTKENIIITEQTGNTISTITDFSLNATPSEIKVNFNQPLKTNSAYNIKFKSTENSISKSIADIKFAVNKSPFMTNNISIKSDNIDLKTMADLQPNKKVNFILTENPEYFNNPNYAIFAAIYKNNILYNIKLTKKTFDGSQSQIELISPNEELTPYNIKYFIWEQNSHMPLIDTINIKGVNQ